MAEDSSSSSASESTVLPNSRSPSPLAPTLPARTPPALAAPSVEEVPFFMRHRNRPTGRVFINGRYRIRVPECQERPSNPNESPPYVSGSNRTSFVYESESTAARRPVEDSAYDADRAESPSGTDSSWETVCESEDEIELQSRDAYEKAQKRLELLRGQLPSSCLPCPYLDKTVACDHTLNPRKRCISCALPPLINLQNADIDDPYSAPETVLGPRQKRARLTYNVTTSRLSAPSNTAGRSFVPPGDSRRGMLVKRQIQRALRPVGMDGLKPTRETIRSGRFVDHLAAYQHDKAEGVMVAWRYSMRKLVVLRETQRMCGGPVRRIPNNVKYDMI